MKAALGKVKATEGFMTAVSPGTIAVFQPNEYYKSHEDYMEALANAMRDEYEKIVDSGILLQLDCPDLAMGRHSRFKNLTEDEFLRHASIQVDALNHALANVPADRVRLHICWGNYEGPHTHDIDLTKVLPLLFRAKPQALLIEGGNPRHDHEWTVWKTHKLPDDKILDPRRHRYEHELRRASGAGVAAHRALREPDWHASASSPAPTAGWARSPGSDRCIPTSRGPS